MPPHPAVPPVKGLGDIGNLNTSTITPRGSGRLPQSSRRETGFSDWNDAASAAKTEEIMCTSYTTPRKTRLTSAEQHALRAGITLLHEELVGRRGIEVKKLPPRDKPGPRFMQRSFFERLLRDDLDLQSCPKNDVCAAQMDIRLLTVYQQLHLRARTLEFTHAQSDSLHLSAHSNFLSTMDQLLYPRLAEGFLLREFFQKVPEDDSGSGSDSECDSNTGSEDVARWLTSDELPGKTELHALGQQLMRAIGAIELISQAKRGPEFSPELPPCWLLQLDDQCWHYSVLALLHPKELWLEIIEGGYKELRQRAMGRKVGVTTACTSSLGRHQWDAAVFDPEEEGALEGMLKACRHKDTPAKHSSRRTRSSRLAAETIENTETKESDLSFEEDPVDAALPPSADGASPDRDEAPKFKPAVIGASVTTSPFLAADRSTKTPLSALPVPEEQSDEDDDSDDEAFKSFTGTPRSDGAQESRDQPESKPERVDVKDHADSEAHPCDASDGVASQAPSDASDGVAPQMRAKMEARRRRLEGIADAGPEEVKPMTEATPVAKKGSKTEQPVDGRQKLAKSDSVKPTTEATPVAKKGSKTEQPVDGRQTLAKSDSVKPTTDATPTTKKVPKTEQPVEASDVWQEVENSEGADAGKEQPSQTPDVKEHPSPGQQKAKKIADYSEKAFDQEIRDLRNRRKALSVGFADGAASKYSGLAPESRQRKYERDLDMTPRGDFDEEPSDSDSNGGGETASGLASSSSPGQRNAPRSAHDQAPTLLRQMERKGQRPPGKRDPRPSPRPGEAERGKTAPPEDEGISACCGRCGTGGRSEQKAADQCTTM